MATVPVELADVRDAAARAHKLHGQAEDARHVLRELMLAAGRSGRYSLDQITEAAARGMGEREAQRVFSGPAALTGMVRDGRAEVVSRALAQARAILSQAAREAFPDQVLTPVEAIVDAAAPALAQALDGRAGGREHGLHAGLVLAQAVVRHFAAGCRTGARDVVSALEVEVADALLRAQG